MKSALKIVFVITLVTFIDSCDLSYKLSKTEWTVPEVKEWASKNRNYSTWKGIILYQGSDSLVHHFIGRINDEWAWFKIKRVELTLDDERPFNNTSTGQFGYYYVDPNMEFMKIKDY